MGKQQVFGQGQKNLKNVTHSDLKLTILLDNIRRKVPTLNCLTSTWIDDDLERDRNIQRNLISYYEDSRHESDEIRLPTGNNSLLDELFASLDESSSEPVKPTRPPMSVKLHEIIAAKLVEIEQHLKDNRQSYLDAMRDQARREYANQRAAEGRSVRPYRKHPSIDGETPAERQQRLHREASRRRAGKDESTVRSYVDRFAMTDDEKKNRKRQQDAASKRRRRDAAKAAKHCSNVSVGAVQ